jgi:pyruvate formate lyase activating enzyme
MKIAGTIKHSLTHFPGLVSYVILTQGCNFRCNYCFNSDLAVIYEPETSDEQRQTEVLTYLQDNHDKIDAVVVTGGEPTVQADLVDFLIKLRSFDYQVKLETNGSNPKTVNQVVKLGLVDYVAVDIKAPLEIDKYKDIAGNHITVPMMANINKTIRILTHSKIEYEVRTTVIKEKHTFHDLMDICNTLVGCKRFCLQQFNAEVVFDQKFASYGNYTQEHLARMIRGINPEIEQVIFR